MSRPLISSRTRNEFREHFVNNGTLSSIRDAFEGCGVRWDGTHDPKVSGQRRTLVMQYYASVDWRDAGTVSCILEVYANEIRELNAPLIESISPDVVERLEAARAALLYWLKIDGYSWQGDRLVKDGSSHSDSALAATSELLEGPHLDDQIRRMMASVETDPELAIGTAKELIETVCKTILQLRGKVVDNSSDMPVLTKAALRELNLVPEGIDEAVTGAQIVKRILQGLGSMGNELARLRGMYGTGHHGKSAKSRGLQARHARLAANAAATLVTFLAETHRDVPAK